MIKIELHKYKKNPNNFLTREKIYDQPSYTIQNRIYTSNFPQKLYILVSYSAGNNALSVGSRGTFARQKDKTKREGQFFSAKNRRFCPPKTFRSHFQAVNCALKRRRDRICPCNGIYMRENDATLLQKRTEIRANW